MNSKAAVKPKQGLLATPPLPKSLQKVRLTDNARQVLERRYVRRGQNGQPAESVDEMFWRVAYHVAKVEEAWNADVEARAPRVLSCCSRAANSFQIRRLLPARARRWDSWQPALSCPLRTTWDAMPPASSRRCAMQPSFSRPAAATASPFPGSGRTAPSLNLGRGGHWPGRLLARLRPRLRRDRTGRHAARCQYGSAAGRPPRY